jgi:hypothetical protein
VRIHLHIKTRAGKMHGGRHFSLELDGFLGQPESLRTRCADESGNVRQKEKKRKGAQT